jgi:hypothetical protein
MEELNYTEGQYKRMRTALQLLFKDHNVKSGRIIKLIKEKKGGDACVPERTYLDKVRRGAIKQPDGPDIKNVWEIIHLVYPDLISAGVGRDPRSVTTNYDHPFFYAAVRYFDVHRQLDPKIMRCLAGRFVFYHFSEMLWDRTESPKRAIVVGQFDLTVIENDSIVVSVSERQAYDGKLGRTMMTETSKGYCLPNNTNLCFVTEAPKFYVFDERHDETLKQTTWMSGYMLKSSLGRRCFHSPVYVERVPDDHEVNCNVLARSDIDPRILVELDKAQPVRDGFGLAPPSK